MKFNEWILIWVKSLGLLGFFALAFLAIAPGEFEYRQNIEDVGIVLAGCGVSALMIEDIISKVNE